MRSDMRLEYKPLTPDRWKDMEELFGECGAYGGCWCMYWRLPSFEWNHNIGEQNKQIIQSIVQAGPPPGILAYSGGKAIGWVSVGPRENFERIERSRTLKRLDDRPTWSVNCFFVAKPFRKSGVMVELLMAAVGYARNQGATLIEGYPLESHTERVSGAESYVGISSVFRKAGFRKARRKIKGSVISRYRLSVNAIPDSDL